MDPSPDAHDVPAAGDFAELHLTPLDIRRAVLADFFRAGGGPLSIGEVVRRMREIEGVDLARLPGVDPRRRVSDMLRHQVREGRAVVVERGNYRLLVHAFSASTAYRCLRWRKVAARRNRYPRWVPLGRAIP